MSLAALGFTMVAVFTVLVMSRRFTAIAALILLPIPFALLAGAGARTGAVMLDGVREVTPTAVVLIFAVLYFGVMIDAGLFQPLVRRLVAWAGNDPVRVTIGQAAISSTVGLDGDGTTTALVGASSMLPVYRRLQMNVLIYGVVGSLSFILMNMSPWGGPAARIAASLRVEPAALFLPMLPVIATGLASVFLLAWWFGRRERARLGRLANAPPAAGQAAEIPSTATLADAFQSDPAALRPRLLPFNLLLTAAIMVVGVARLAPFPVVFMTGLALALVVNYPTLADQRARLGAHAANALSVGTLVFSAGAFTGVLSGTGMTDAMAKSILVALPPELGPYLGVITALISIPANFLLSADAFYFGILPIIAETGQAYGITPEEIGRASLLGQPLHTLSPLTAAVYLKCALIGVDLADLQRFAWKYALGLCCVLIVAAVAFGVIPLVR